jgi:hypothetical protein
MVFSMQRQLEEHNRSSFIIIIIFGAFFHTIMKIPYVFVVEVHDP